MASMNSTLPTATFYVFYILRKMSLRKLAPQFLLVMNVYPSIPHVSLEEKEHQLYKMIQLLPSFPFTFPLEEVIYLIFVFGQMN